ncbi:SKP1-like protein 4 [Lolium perenne]|uniref:SKP1-like protein 4 n=1 Tax=Lolium perenne TaxID=4522 RepID=UPI0021EA876D|nr:SKP1-like protein 4 [Lolium perenne]
MVLLVSSDGEKFEVADEVIGKASGMIKGCLDEDCATNGQVPIPNVTGRILALILEYVNKHFAEPHDDFQIPNADDPLKRFDDAFVHVDQDTLFDLITAANYLNINSLLDLTCKAVADQMRGKTTEETRKHFNIVNDYTPEEEEEVRRENSWAFE